MKYLAQILLQPKSETIEIQNNKSKLYIKFKALFIKKETKIIQETFSVPDFLTKLNLAMKSLGVSNLVRITHDEVDFYLDKEHKPNDLDEVIQELGYLIRSSFERFFEEISVLLEFEQDEIYYLIDLILARVHPVGQYPVQIIFSGLPRKVGIENVEEKFKLFVNTFEMNLHKYIDVSDITTSFTKKGDLATAAKIEKESEAKSSGEPKRAKQKCNFFPLYGVMLGETTVDQLSKLGTRALDYDSDKQLYKYYNVKDMRFWFSGNFADHMYITYTDPIPRQWLNCGFDWSLSYNNWIVLFEKLGFFISVVIAPKVEWYNGKRSLSAEFLATKKLNAKITICFEMDFSYSQRKSLDSEGTLYSIRVRST